MKNKIIGREREKKIFQQLLASDKAELLTIYGRRRVGKTFLIREYFEEELAFSFTGAFEAKLSTQLFNFYNELKGVSKKHIEQPKNWAEAFLLLTDFLTTFTNNNKKVVVFFDELPWLDTPKSDFLSAFEYFWNQHGSRMKNLLLITCGSAASWIISNLVNAKGGLYNRITQRIELKPFTLQETEQYCFSRNLQFTHYQLIQLYIVLGGVPFYWQFVESGKSVNQVIGQLCFEENSFLSDEFTPLYHSLFKNAENHIAVIEALVEKPYGLTRNDIAKATKISAGGSLSRTLTNLEASGFIKTITSFGKKSKETIFRVIDFYSIFYLKFIKGNVSERFNTWQNLSKEASYISWTGYTFENICLTHLRPIHEALGIAGVYTQVSSLYYKGNSEIGGIQINLVIDRNDGIIHLCEAKFTSTEFVLTKEYTSKLRVRRATFQHLTKTKKAVVTTLLTTFPAIQNSYYFEEIHSEIPMEHLFR